MLKLGDYAQLDSVFKRFVLCSPNFGRNQFHNSVVLSFATMQYSLAMSCIEGLPEFWFRTWVDCTFQLTFSTSPTGFLFTQYYYRTQSQFAPNSLSYLLYLFTRWKWKSLFLLSFNQSKKCPTGRIITLEKFIFCFVFYRWIV